LQWYAKAGWYLSNEVRYYGQDGENPHGFFIEPMDSHGGWIASVVDLARLFSTLDGFAGRPDQLNPESFQEMIRPPDIHQTAESPVWYGLGFLVRQHAAGQNLWHNGSLPGTHALVVRAFDDTLWIVLFNSRPKDWSKMAGDVDNALRRARDTVGKWPTHNRFNKFP